MNSSSNVARVIILREGRGAGRIGHTKDGQKRMQDNSWKTFEGEYRLEHLNADGR
jgi:hypothetical protein